MRIERNGLAAEWAAFRAIMLEEIPGLTPEATAALESAFYAGAGFAFGAVAEVADLQSLLAARHAEIAAFLEGP